MERAVGGDPPGQQRGDDEKDKRRPPAERPPPPGEQASQTRAPPPRGPHEGGAPHHISPIRPLSADKPSGRFWMKTMMNTSTAILASTAPDQASINLLTMPSPIAAYTVPASWPTPPSTTTINESTM